jgi:DNA-binding PadR family transcriptional regulator
VADLEAEIMNMMHERVVKNFLDMVILMELKKHSMSGYNITSFINNKFNMLMGSGTVYSYLYFLEKNGLVKAEGAQEKKVYTLTEQGKERVRAFSNSRDKILGLVLNLFIGV